MKFTLPQDVLEHRINSKYVNDRFEVQPEESFIQEDGFE